MIFATLSHNFIGIRTLHANHHLRWRCAIRNARLLMFWSLLLLKLGPAGVQAETPQSGVRFTINVLPAGDKPVTKDQCLAAGKVLERRLAPRGRRDITITVEGEDTLQIQLSGMTPSELDQNRRSVESMGTLEFRAVAPPAIEALIEQREPTARVIRKGFEELPFLKALEPKEATPKAENPSAEAPKLDPEARAKQRREKFYTDKNTTMVSSESLLTGKSIRQAFAQASPGSKEFAISVTLTPEAGKQMKAISEEHLGQPLAIVVDKEVLSKPTIQGVFGEHFQITGWFSQKEATDLASALANPLQNPLKITQIAELKTAP